MNDILKDTTPGPWVVMNNGFNYGVLHNNELVAAIEKTDDDDGKANAALIAAAPDMAAEVERLRAALELAHELALKDKHIAELEAACLAFVEAYEKSGQLEKTDRAVRMARQALGI